MYMKKIIMYRTALYAEKINTEILSKKAIDLIEDFNKGSHVVDNDNKINTYSVLDEN